MKAFSVNDEGARGVVETLCNLSFFGLETDKGIFRFAEDPADCKKLRALSNQFCSRSGSERRFKIHPAFHAYLETAKEPVRL
jgi:hypothetical protein